MRSIESDTVPAVRRTLVVAAVILAAPSMVQAEVLLLFDKNCAHCTVCEHADHSGRRPGAATLTLLERSESQFVPLARWSAVYGAHEGYKVRLRDSRTPEGLYYTTWINDQTHADDYLYGFLSITTDYPNEEDRRSCQPQEAARQCSHDGDTACVDPGSAISIHGGMSRPTQGCIRLLDRHIDPGRCHGRPINCQSIAELARWLRDKTVDGRVPLLAVRQASRSCRSAVGQPVGATCAQGLLRILAAHDRPSRELVNAWMSDSTPDSSSAAFSEPTLASLESDSTVVGGALHPEGVWATSEAPLDRCDGKGRAGETCAAERLIDGRSETAWCEAADGTGVGEWLTFQFSARQTFSRIRIKNGNWRAGRGSTQWSDQGYVEQLDVVINGRHVLCQDPNGDPSELECDVDGLAGSQVSLRIARAAPGDTSMDTCISEIVFEGSTR